MSEPEKPHSMALQRFDLPGDPVYTIEAVVQITRISRHQIAVYCRHGLLAPLTAPEDEGWRFDDEAIRTLRRIEHLRSSCGVNLAGLRMISALLREREELRREARHLRQQADPAPPGHLSQSS